MNRFKKLKAMWMQNVPGRSRLSSGAMCRFTLLAMCLTLLGGALPGRAQSSTVLFRDDFTSPLNTTNWGYYDDTYSIHRTQFGNVPVVDTTNGWVRLHLDSYNPDPTYGSDFLKGTEMFSKTKFPIGSGGTEFEARVRGTNIPAGTLGAFFTFGDKGVWPDTYLWDEVDYEILGNYPSNQLWLNVWDDYSPVNGGPHLDSHPAIAGLNWKNWTDYKVRAYPYVTQFFVNDVLVRSSYDIVPTDPMALRFNIWAPNDSWTAAFDKSITTTTQANNKDYYFDVDYVQVKSLSPGIVGTGTGLTANYYNSENLTGAAVTRIDPQVNFNWGNNSPATGINTDGFSTRWTGQVLAPFTETYTFTTNSDDGVRLWVNGQQLVNNWTSHGPTENSGTIALTAGVRYDIKVEYYDHAFGAVAQLFWSSPSLPRRAIPQSQLYPTSGGGSTPVPLSISTTTPANGSTITSLPAISGTAAGTGLNHVDLYLYRASDAKWWNGAAWGTTKTSFPATLTNGSWTRNTALPVAGSSDATKALTTGSYSIGAWVYDNTGKSKNVSTQFTANVATPTPVPLSVAIVTPANGSTITSLPAISGTAGGTNLSRVDLYLYRSIDRKWWTGAAWGTVQTPFTATITNGSWTRNSSLPVAGSSDATKALTNGSYSLGAWAYDTAGTIKNVSAQFTVSGTTGGTTGPVTGTGTGLSATYYDNIDFTGTTVTRVDPQVNFDWGSGSPAAGIGADTFSVRWSGQVQAQVNATYTFATNSDDGVRLWVNGQMLIDNWASHAPTVDTGAITLTAGVKYNIKMEYYENGYGAVAQLFWNTPSSARQAIPKSQLYPASGNPAAGELWEASDLAVGSDNLSHLLWQRPDQAFSIWNLSASGAVTSTPIVGPIANWSAYGIGVGGDFKVRTLLGNTNAQAQVRTIQDVSTGAFTNTPDYGPYTGFVCRDIAVGADNTTRLMWVRSDGAFSVWTVDATGNYASTPLFGPISNWTPVAISVGGDEKTCVLLDNVNGQSAVWSIQDIASGSVTSTPALGTVGGFACRDFAVGSDNKLRLLWVRSDGAFTVWTVQDISSGSVTSTPLYGPMAGWSARKAAVGGDLKTRLLLNHTDGRAIVWTLESSGAYTNTPIYGPVTTSV